MRNLEIKQHFDTVIELVNYCTENKIKYTPLIIGLLDTFDLLKAKVDNIDKCISKELKELEQKILTFAKENKEKLSDKEKSKITNDIEYGISFLIEKDKVEYKKLISEYMVQMNEDIKFTIPTFELTNDDLNKFEMDVQHVVALRNYIKKGNDK